MVWSSARKYSPARSAMAKLIPSAEMPKPENIGRIVTGPKSENRSIRKSRSIVVAQRWVQPELIPHASLRANGSRARAPDDRLRAAIHTVTQRLDCCVACAPRNDDDAVSDGYTFAAVSCTDSPQPQAPVWFGLLKMNCADILSTL